MPPFRYFLAPEDCMSGLSHHPETCTFCGKRARSFDLGQKRFGCPECLHSGHFTITHDTEIGLIDGNTILLLGVTSRNEDDFLVPLDATDKIGMPEAQLRELQCNPDFLSWNYTTWMVCCGDFMAYLGDWKPKDFASRDAFIEAIEPETDAYTARMLWPEEDPPDDFGDLLMHVFRCLHCNRLRAQDDCT